jgi:hypothetical protein
MSEAGIEDDTDGEGGTPEEADDGLSAGPPLPSGAAGVVAVAEGSVEGVASPVANGAGWASTLAACSTCVDVGAEASRIPPTAGGKAASEPTVGLTGA